MKSRKLLFVICVLFLGSLESAWAGGRWRGSVGVYVGPGAFWGAPVYRPHYYPGPYYYPAPYYVSPPVYIAPETAPVYIERNDAVVEQTEASNYWHYCRESKSYYPYVKECPGGWQQVLPQPAK